MKRLVFAGIMLAWGLCWVAPCAADWEGKVIDVRGGGDILSIQTDDNRHITLRLYGIDCPEIDQPFGVAAESLVRALVVEIAKPITVIEERRDSTGQVLATVVLHDGTTLNARLLLAGLAWYYPDNCVDTQYCQEMEKLEAKARQGRRGLWSQDDPVPPWKWNEKQKDDQREQK